MRGLTDIPVSGRGSRPRAGRSLTVVAGLVTGAALVIPTGSAWASTPRTADPVGGPKLAAAGLVYDPASRTVAAPPNVAEGFLLADLDTGDVLVAKAAHKRLRPASTQKTLTAVTLMPRLDPKAVYTVQRQDTFAEGTRVGVVEKGTYTVDALFHALLLASGNDAASALANAYGGWDKTLTAMAAEAKRLKAFDTTAKNPSGLDESGQYSSAYDLALIGRAAMRIPQFVATAGQTSYDFPAAMPRAGQKRATYKIYTQNRLLLHDYPGAIAGKTGYTSLARRTFWVTAKQGDRTLLISMLNITSGTEAAARALLDWGFRYADRLSPVGELVEPEAAAAVGPAPGGSHEGGGDTAGDTAGDTVAAASGVPTPSGGTSPLLGLALLLAAGAAVVVGMRTRALARERERISERARARRLRYQDDA